MITGRNKPHFNQTKATMIGAAGGASKSILTPIAGATIGTGMALGSWLIFDYQTCHPFRRMQGWKPEEAIVRLRNTIRPAFTYQVYQLQDVAKYDGSSSITSSSSQEQQVYFSSDGYVWDVSASESFLNGYKQFCGKDASFALALMSMSDKDINRTDWDTLTTEDWDSLKSWTKYFKEKFIIRGRLEEFEDRPPKQ